MSLSRRTYNARRLPTRFYPPMSRQRNTAVGAYAPNSARRARFNRARSMTQLSRNRRISTAGVLGGSDANQRLIYVRKRMPRNKRRRWRAFVKKVNAVDEKDLGTRTVLFNDQIQSSVATGGATSAQGCMTQALYSVGASATPSYLADLRSIGNLENTGDQTAAAGNTVYPTTKIIFHSAVLDLTIRNASVQSNDSTPPIQQLAGDIELDLYEMTIGKDSVSHFNGTTIEMSRDISSALNREDTPEIGGVGNGIAIQDRGASPWEFPHNLGRYRIRIHKKTKFFIPSGRTITYQVRDAKRHVLQHQQLRGEFSTNHPGMTKFIYMIYKLVPGLNQATVTPPPQLQYDARIEIGNTRKYMYKVEGINEDRERYITNTSAPVNPS